MGTGENAGQSIFYFSKNGFKKYFPKGCYKSLLYGKRLMAFVAECAHKYYSIFELQEHFILPFLKFVKF